MKKIAEQLYEVMSVKGSATLFRHTCENTIAHMFVTTLDYITLNMSADAHKKEIEHVLLMYPDADMITVYVEDALIVVSTTTLQ